MKKLFIICILALSCITLDAQVKCNGGLFLKMTHKATVARGSAVMVDFMLTNRTQGDIDISFKKESSKIMDNTGTTYSGNNVTFDFANTGLDYGMIPGGCSVKFRCIVTGLDENASSIPLMMINYRCSLSDSDEWTLFVRKVKFFSMQE